MRGKQRYRCWSYGCNYTQSSCYLPVAGRSDCTGNLYPLHPTYLEGVGFRGIRRLTCLPQAGAEPSAIPKPCTWSKPPSQSSLLLIGSIIYVKLPMPNKLPMAIQVAPHRSNLRKLQAVHASVQIRPGGHTPSWPGESIPQNRPNVRVQSFLIC